MNKEYYLNCIDKGITLYWHTLCKARGILLHRGDVEWAMSIPQGGVERIFNISLTDAQANERVDELIEKIKRKEAPSGILITPHSKPKDLDKILSMKGFHVEYDTGSGMALDLDESINRMKFNKGISITPVKDIETLKVWVSIVSTALFEENLFSVEQFQDILHLDNTRFYLGLLNGQPASTCMTIVDGEIATVEMVSTLKEYRNNGLGTAITTTALQELAKTGVKTATLRAEKEAINVYRRIGFQEYYKRIIACYEY